MKLTGSLAFQIELSTHRNLNKSPDRSEKRPFCLSREGCLTKGDGPTGLRHQEQGIRGMALIDPKKKPGLFFALPDIIPEEIQESDEKNFLKVVSTGLTPEQEERIINPPQTYPRQSDVLAVHWHPEFVPPALIDKRIETLFPNLSNELIIPTQHNVILSRKGYSGVEVDCFSIKFKQKVQLLIHCRDERLEKADVLKSMIAYTFKYRSSQLYDYIHALIKPEAAWLDAAARETGAEQNLIRFVRTYVRKVHDLLEKHRDSLEPAVVKNKILRDFFDTLRPQYGDGAINMAQAFLKAVKTIVKAHFPHHHFYKTREIIEEARAVGARIIIPHPEQFWPILLAEYDVDGYEVWNPQSREYTEFLISVLDRKNKHFLPSQRKLLVIMGDDTHMAEKLKDPSQQDRKKASREIGVQPAWDELSIRKRLIIANMDRRRIIEEYKNRLNG
jgi:hypothetical protein